MKLLKYIEAINDLRDYLGDRIDNLNFWEIKPCGVGIKFMACDHIGKIPRKIYWFTWNEFTRKMVEE